MAAGYDENVLENPFFKALKGKYNRIYEDAASRRLTICIPRFGSLGRTVPTQTDIENHILSPSNDTEKIFETLNKREVIVDGHLLRTVSGFHDVRQVEILFEETFFNVKKESFSILCIERPLEGGAGVIANGLGPLETVHDCVEFLWPPYAGPYTSKQNIDLFLDSFNKAWSVEFSQLGTLMGNIIAVLNKLFPMVMKESHLRKPAKSGNFMETVKLALETYVLHKLHGKLFPAICTLCLQKDGVFNKVVRNLVDIQVKDLGIKPLLKPNIPSARRALSSLNQYTTPLEKFNCLKQTIVGVTMLKDGKNQEQGKVLAVTADDLLPILECLVIKSELPNWMANLTYLHNFRFSNRTYDEFRFYMSSFEAAVEYIRKSYRFDARLDVSLKPKFLKSEDSLTTFRKIVSSEMKKDDLIEGTKTCSPLEVFFEHVTNCRDFEVKRILNSSCTNVKLCHPLCSCDQCEQVLDRHKNDPEAVTVVSRDDLGRTALHLAADYGHTSTVHLLVQKGSIVNATDYHGSSPLHLACQRGHQQATMLLLHYNADISAQDNDGNTALHLSSSHGHLECAKALVYFDLHNEDLDVNATNEHGDTPLHLATRWGFEAIVKLLLDNGASPGITNKKNETASDCALNTHMKRLLGMVNLETQYVVVPENITPSKVRPVSNRDISKSPKLDPNQIQIEGFLKTIIEGDIRMVYHKLGLEDEWLDDEGEQQSSAKNTIPSLCHPLCQCEKCIQYQQEVVPSPYRKVDINSRGLNGKTALHLSSLYGFDQITNVLLKHGALPNIPDDNRKCLPLHLACQYNRPKVVAILLQHHADVDCQDIRGNTPLHYCCQNGNSEPAKILIKSGATLNIVNERGNTPLHDAAKWSSLDIVHLLLENGASLNIKNQQGSSALQIAKHDEVVKVLSQRTVHEKSFEHNKFKQYSSNKDDDTIAGFLTNTESDSEQFFDASNIRDSPLVVQDHDATLSTSGFFEDQSHDRFSSSSMTLSSPNEARMFPRKLPEIQHKAEDESADHRATAIEQLHEVLEGIKLFDRKTRLRKTNTLDRSDPLSSTRLKLQFSIQHFDPSRLKKVVKDKTSMHVGTSGNREDSQECDSTNNEHV